MAQVVVTAVGLVALANRAAENLFDVSAKDIGRPFHDLQLSYRPVELRRYIEQAQVERRTTQAREELETMNEELHSTNDELQTTNDELRERSAGLDQANAFLEAWRSALATSSPATTSACPVTPSRPCRCRYRR
ncbi:MAG TPA: PAS domain-containing protein [Micromonosporaceae bacterium]|nr:PAS domain-containing protein [Micromonosporaceae bacterium]